VGVPSQEENKAPLAGKTTSEGSRGRKRRPRCIAVKLRGLGELLQRFRGGAPDENDFLV